MARSRVDVVRVYEDRGRSSHEYRVLVDRLWPRGLKKAAVDLDEWAKDVAPSDELRRWYGHVPVPSAQLVTRSNVLGPFVEVDGGFLQSPRPQAVHQHPVLVAGATPILVHPDHVNSRTRHRAALARSGVVWRPLRCQPNDAARGACEQGGGGASQRCDPGHRPDTH